MYIKSPSPFHVQIHPVTAAQDPASVPEFPQQALHFILQLSASFWSLSAPSSFGGQFQDTSGNLPNTRCSPTFFLPHQCPFSRECLQPGKQIPAGLSSNRFMSSWKALCRPAVTNLGQWRELVEDNVLEEGPSLISVICERVVFRPERPKG